MKKIALMLVLVLAFAGVGEAAVKIVAAHNQTTLDNPYQYGMIKFKEVLEKLSGGEMEVEVHAGTIGTNESELVEKLKLGAADLVIASPGFMTKIGVPEVDLFALPYLFNGFDHWEKVVDGEIGQELSKIINEKTKNTFKIVGYWSASVRDYYGKKPIYKPEDLKGMKIRTQNSAGQVMFWTNCGAIPTSVAWGELYQALQQGVVDGAENDYTNFSLMDHHKTPNGCCISEIGHDVTTRLALMNGKKFDAMTDQQKKWVLEAIKQATAEERAVTYRMRDESKAQVIKDGAKTNEVDKAPFIAIAIPIQDELAKKSGLTSYIEKIRAVK